jgi:hypothetical protein
MKSSLRKCTCVVCAGAVIAGGLTIASETECPHQAVCQPAILFPADGPESGDAPAPVTLYGGMLRITASVTASTLGGGQALHR